MNQFIRVATGINNFRSILFIRFILHSDKHMYSAAFAGVLMTFLSLGFRFVSPVATQLHVATARSLCYKFRFGSCVLL